MTYWGESAQKESISGVFDALEQARKGISLREAGYLDEAEQIFRSIINAHPGKSVGWQELAIVQVKRRDCNAALDSFRQAVAAEPSDLLTRSHLVLHLQSMGDSGEAHRVLTAHPSSTAEMALRISALGEFVDYLDEWPRMRALSYPNHVERNLRFLNCAEVETDIERAIEQKSPFSLVRLGDGEGSWMMTDPADEARYRNLYFYNRRQMLNTWFGSEKLLSDTAFEATRMIVMNAISNASIVGVPYSLRLNREYDLKSIRGVPSCLNILRFAVDTMTCSAAAFCSHDIHVELQDSGFYRRLFKSGAPLGLITCHAQLPYKIAVVTGARVVRTHLIPEEKGFSDVLGDEHVEGPHYPSAYNRVVQELQSADQKGVVWLVSAGYLGKIYGEVIRRRGGVAIDIGSITDGWCEKVTRPPLRDRERFAL